MLRKIWRNPQAVIGLGLIVLICAVAILAPLLAPHAPDEVNPLMKYQAPSADYPLGTDQLGRCELSRLLYGARASLGLALPILILLGGIGLILGMMTACIGGWFDRVVTGISQVFIAFPTLIIAVAIIGVLGNGLQNIIWAVVISMWARFMQLIRTYAKTELGRDYVVAARVSGCGMWQLIVHHLIPNSGFRRDHRETVLTNNQGKATAVVPLHMELTDVIDVVQRTHTARFQWGVGIFHLSEFDSGSCRELFPQEVQPFLWY